MQEPRPLSNTNTLYAWLNKVRDVAMSAVVTVGSGLNGLVTANGTNISLKNITKGNSKVDYLAYDPTKAYRKGTITRVTASFSSSFNNGSTVVPVSSEIGSYIAVQNIPKYYSPTDKAAIVANIPSYLTGSLNQTLRRDEGSYNWIYAPISPEPIYTKETFPNVSSSNYLQNQPRFWEKIGASASGSVVDGSTKYFATTALSNADYFSAVPLTLQGSGSALTCSIGTTTRVAKMAHMRCSVTSDIFDGVTVNYSSIGDNYRIAATGSVSEIQVTYPRYTTMASLNLTGSTYQTGSILYGSTAQNLINKRCVVKCIPITTGLYFGSSSINYEEVDTRVWARRYIQ